MKTRLFTILIILAIGLAGFTQPAQAQAYDTSFTTSITYQNVGTAATTTLQILFYATPTSITPIPITRNNLEPGAGSSVSIGTLGEIDPGFKGSAIMQADQPMLATLVQVPQSTTVLVRPMSNGFAGGAAQSLVATVLKHMFSANTVISVQNVDAEDNDITIKFFNKENVLVHEADIPAVAPGAATYWDTGAEGDPLGTSFNGSAVITAKRNNLDDGLIVSSAMELDYEFVGALGYGAKAFEGVAEGATDYFMPSALCKYDAGGGLLQDTSYAVQNADPALATHVTVTFDNGFTAEADIAAGSKASFVTCNAVGMPEGYKGAARVHSDTTPIIAMGKAYNGGLSTAFIGAAAGSGTAKVALPYVRWAINADYTAGDGQRSYIAIQNIGAGPLTGDITVKYIDCFGVLQGTHTISVTDMAVGEKVNSNASLALIPEFGICDPVNKPAFGGGALVEGPVGSELAAIVRVQTMDTNFVPSLGRGEDYNGLNVP